MPLYIGPAPKVTETGIFLAVSAAPGRVKAFNLDGSLRWSNTLPVIFDTVTGDALSPHGSVYYVVYWNALLSGHLVAFQTNDGTQLWDTIFTAWGDLSSFPVVNNKTGDIYVLNMTWVGTNQLVAITKFGLIKWSASLATSPVWYLPAVSPDGTRLYVPREHPVSTNNLLACINASDSTDIWVTPDTGFDLIDNVNCIPLLSSDGSTIYFFGGVGSRTLYAYNNDGTLKWSYNTAADPDRPWGISLLPGGDIIMTCEIEIYRHSQVDGHRIWTYVTPGGTDRNISVDRNGVIYTMDVVFGLMALDQNGNVLIPPTGIAVGSEIAIGNGRIYYYDNPPSLLYCVR